MSRKSKDVIEVEIKEKVFEAASRILSKHSPDKLTMDMIARETKLAKGTLYNYFRDKADVIGYLSVKSLEPYLDRADEIVSARMPIIEKLKLYIDLHIQMSRERRELVTVLSQSSPLYAWQRRKDVIEVQQRSIEQLRAIVNQGVGEGVFTDLASEDIMLIFRGIVTAFSRPWLIIEEKDFVPLKPDKIIEIFMHGIAV